MSRRSEEHTSELQSRSDLVCRLLLEKKKKQDHPAQKPVLLYETPIRNHLAVGEPVYEPFLGSGTCLVAAETLGRRCLAMEIEPRYVQVSIERWQSLTGRQARRAD